MKMNKIFIKTKSKSYPIYFGNKILVSTGSLVKKNLPGVKKIYIITDNNLPNIVIGKLKNSLKNYNLTVRKFKSVEKTKSFNIANKIIKELLNKNFNRSDCVIALGGGILGDLSAFVASITKRGLKFINIPTTLLAQVDSAIGGKTAINSHQGKNLIGTFYQPDFVISDISTLSSLPKREMICGYGEILKHSLIADKKLFFWLSNNAKKMLEKRDLNLLKFAIIKSCKIKSKIVSLDEREKNLRMILNFGHTFAHGFEGVKKFSKILSHGEAVLLGMIMACQLAYQKKILTIKELLIIKKHYSLLKLPNNIRKIFNLSEINKIIYFVKKDKKNLNDKINLILIKKIGKATKPNSFSISVKEFKKFLIESWNKKTI